MDIHGKSQILTVKAARCLFILHPGTSLLYIILFITIAFMFNHPAFVAAAFIFSVLQAAYFAGLKTTLNRLKVYALFGLFLVIITPIFNRRGTHVLFYIFDKQFTLEALSYGIYSMVLLLTLLTVFITFNCVIPSVKFLYLFSRAAPQTAFMVNMTLRFGALLKSQGEDYAAIQSTRGNRAEKPTFISKIINQGAILSSFALWSLENGLSVSETLRAKEYGRAKRSSYQTYIFTMQDAVFTMISLAIFILMFALYFFNDAKYDYFRTLTDLSFNSYYWAAFTLGLLYQLLPFGADFFQSIRRSLTN